MNEPKIDQNSSKFLDEDLQDVLNGVNTFFQVFLTIFHNLLFFSPNLVFSQNVNNHPEIQRDSNKSYEN